MCRWTTCQVGSFNRAHSLVRDGNFEVAMATYWGGMQTVAEGERNTAA